ncbi:hypothetical protein [Maliponia aquimaris]|uniref:Uncharacterized protein n=1 Tax=Maliponia aquimaris TaxID=1673631 RepID=A0A238K7W6_9RHOB|nr:hypothetical protein [Maliponia aquimaris]SMX38990.1 hypothetical protein MAA8898_01823 [Maliponia aquimaris]
MFEAILVFASVLLGALMALFLPWWSALWWLGLPLVAVFAVSRVWPGLVRSRPILAVWLGLSGYALVILSSATAVYGGVALSGVVPGWVAGLATGIDADTVKAVSGVLSGAVATLIGALWLDDARSTEGTFWPPGAYKRAIGAAYAGSDLFDVPLGGARRPELERLYAMVYDDRVFDGSTSGWRLAARLSRARAIRDLDTSP